MRFEDWSEGGILAVALGAAIALLVVGLVWMARRFTRDTHPDRHEPEQPQAYTPPAVLEDPHGATNQQVYDITGKLTWISRAPGENSAHVRTLVIRDKRISRDHAIIQYRDQGYWISDRGSANGTFVNGKQVTEERLLRHGDRLEFAGLEFRFSIPHREDLPETIYEHGKSPSGV